MRPRHSLAGIITFRRLEAVSFTHSTIYLALLVCAFVLHKPQPETFAFGLAHGVLWIGMSLVCLAAARARIIPFWLAVTVAVLGGLGPFAGTIGFVIAARALVSGAAAADTSVAAEPARPARNATRYS